MIDPGVAGAVGAARVVNALEVPAVALGPLIFVATTEAVYSVDPVSPVTKVERVAPETLKVLVVPAPVGVTVTV